MKINENTKIILHSLDLASYNIAIPIMSGTGHKKGGRYFEKNSLSFNYGHVICFSNRMFTR